MTIRPTSFDKVGEKSSPAPISSVNPEESFDYSQWVSEETKKSDRPGSFDNLETNPFF